MLCVCMRVLGVRVKLRPRQKYICDKKALVCARQEGGTFIMYMYVYTRIYIRYKTVGHALNFFFFGHIYSLAVFVQLIT